MTEKLPNKLDQEIKDAFTSGWAMHGIDELEHYLKSIDAWKAYIKQLENYILSGDRIEIHGEDITYKITEKLQDVKDNHESKDIREFAAKALEKIQRYYNE
jgi:hypothetical protein